eukprot:gene9533-1739_t
MEDTENLKQLEEISEKKDKEIKKVFIDDFNDDPNFIIEDIKKIQNSIKHLQRSNFEMKEFDPELKDKDFSDAIKENIIVIEKKRKEIQKLTKLLSNEHQKLLDFEVLEESTGIEL